MTSDTAGFSHNGVDAHLLNGLFRVSQALCGADRKRVAMTDALAALCEIAELPRGILVLKSSEEELEVAAAHGASAAQLRAIRDRPHGEATQTILTSGEPLVVSRVEDDPRLAHRITVLDASLPFMGFPIFSRDGVVVGVLEVQPVDQDPQREEPRKRLCQLTAALIGCGLESPSKPNLETSSTDKPFRSLVGATPAMQRLFEQMRQVAKWNTTVLILGESGTGKELIANAIHFASPRARGPFVKLNCAALPESLLESELFGYERGAFTGAQAQHQGRFEKAHRGSIFLDEIGEISPSFQAKLLRVLQEGEFERVGGTQTLKVDVRVIAATNRDLERAVADKKFRRDLYYRLNVMPLMTPPLRDRKDDLGELSEHIVEKIGTAQGRELSVTESAVGVLRQHDWPGNVRELENCLERAAIMSGNGTIDERAVRLAGIVPTRENPKPTLAPRTVVDLHDPSLDERARVMAALEQAGWVQAKAARLLGMTPRQIAYRIQTMKIDVKRF